MRHQPLALQELRRFIRVLPHNGGPSRNVEVAFFADESPLRDELLSLGQLEQHAKVLAGLHEVDPRPGRDRLRARLADNEAVLLVTYKVISEASRQSRRLTPEAEWLLDNFHLIEEQIRTARQHLPKAYSRQLPRLATGLAAGFPRVYDIALELISHADGLVDSERLNAFTRSYQTVAHLELGELWAVPIMLRLALIENVRRVAARMASGRRDRDVAERWAHRMLEMAEHQPGNLVLVLADMVRAKPALTTPFVAEFAQHLQGRSPSLILPLTWLEQRLAEQGQSVESVVQQESRNQAADQVSIGNSISSLRFLSSADWREFVEAMSVVEHTLRGDPAGVYATMDFSTRDRYRHVVEELSNDSGASEEQVAQAAIDMARQYPVGRGLPGGNGSPRGVAPAPETGHGSGPTGHVGYYLVGKGRVLLERAVGVQLTPKLVLQRVGRRHPLPIYTGAILMMTGAITAGLLFHGRRYGSPDYELALLLLPLLVAASHLAVAITNWLATLLAKPRHIPRLDFSNGIPPDCQTLVVVPAMLTSIPAVAELLEALEIRFLGNLQPNLHFALLTDFPDAAAEHLPSDADLLSTAIDRIEALNQKYDSQPFFLFHRPRRWNPQEGVWMGWERKRGKLADLNTLLRGNGQHRFSIIVGNASVLPAVRYVITLDSDTQLPPDTAHQLIGAMAHPLNRPVFDAGRNVVVEGYGVLQPRVGTTLTSATRSRFARLFSSDAGVDPYTRVVSNVYQDVFGEGSFIGKGIYDVDAFERALGGRLPENRILSHDLLEGGYARCGLVSDCLLFENFPRHYLTDMGRRHRWIRGDWQIASWILPRVPGPGTVPISANPLSGISRWKIFDNLRRSLVPIAVVVLLVVAWLTGLQSANSRGLAPLPLFWTLWTLALLLSPVLLSALSELLHRPPDLPLGLHVRWAVRVAGQHFAEAVFSIACLPFEAYSSADAILRTLLRLRRRQSLLEWRTAGDAEREGDSFGSLLRSMIMGPVLAGSLVIILLVWRRDALVAAGPLAALWMVGPIAAWSLSWRLVPRPPRLREDQRLFLRGNARRTWRFFETFVTPAENWLPPDNYQEHPAEVTAHRTSPTNIGLALLANLAAFDLGYVSSRRLLDRSTGTLESMRRLQQHRGHLLNWYNTLTLEPLPPQYVSAVDSGNLWGALVVLRQGLQELPDSKILSTRAYEGLRDTLRVLSEEAEKAANAEDVGEPLPPDLPARIQRLKRDLDHAPPNLSAWRKLLQHLTETAAELTASLGAGGEDAEAQEAEQRGLGALRWWAQAFQSQCRDLHDDLALLSPWSTLSWPAEAAWRPAEPGEQAQRLGELLEVVRGLEKIPTLRQVAQLNSLLPIIDALLKAPREAGKVPQPHTERGSESQSSGRQWLEPFRQAFEEASQRAAERISEIGELEETCEELADMDFDFLYDRSRHLLAIGYNVTDRRRDTSYYDLLASEARLGSYLAIAHRKLPYEHWFRLSRLVTTVGGEPVLLSWSGSMFEYLMPLLFMPTYSGTLLDETCQGVVRRQIEYGRQSSVPWGISESAYNATDQHLNYQYRAFGVPGLGFKRGLSDDLVIAPYATELALLIDPAAACRNLQRLARDGQVGRFGFYEAVDYTPSRVPRGQTHATIRSFMAHHQGMTLLSLAHCLLDRPMQRRFLADLAVRACELLLQERIPRIAPVFPHVAETGVREAERAEEPEVAGSFRLFNTPHTPVPEVHLLSNGRYHVMISAAGGGYSRWKDLAVSRWRSDPTQDNWGSFCYVRDPQRGRFWSTTYQPTLRDARRYEAIFSQARAEFRRRDDHLDIHTEISVSPEDDIELRRVTITNQGRDRRAIELTSYAEVTLLPPTAEATHPAFANLFVQTEIFPSRRAILCTRRPRSKHEHSPWMFHLMASHGIAAGEASYETARDKFIGRGRTLIDPAAMHVADLSNSQGAVLDPIVSVRRMVTLEPDQSVQLDIVTGVTETREQALALIEKYHDDRLADRVFELAWTHKQVVLRQLQATEADAQLYGRLVGSILYPSPLLRAPAAVIARSNRGQSGLWGYGISGDLPIVLVRVSEKTGLGLVRKMVQAHAYWRLRGLAVDLVIWNEDHSTYRQELQDGLVGLIAAGPESQFLDRPGGIFVRRIEQISEDDKALIQTVARVIITDTAGSLAEQTQAVLVAAQPGSRTRPEASRPPRLFPQRSRRPEPSAPPLPPPTKGNLAFFNGLGGFTPDGREYYVTTSSQSRTPAPWANVMGNPGFGTVVTENGGGYTWAENAHEFRLTPWCNDAVTDVSGEHLYLRDEETGRFWSPTPLPAGGRMPYTTRHGFGYSIFEYADHGISSQLSTYIATDAPVKFLLLKVRNTSGRSVRLSATGFVEWVLGEQRSRNMMHVVTELHPGTGAILARNPYNSEFPNRVAFFNVSETQRTVTGSREEFLGRNGSYGQPAAMDRRGLSGSIGPGLDPCAAMQVGFELADNEEREIVFVLGAARSINEADELIRRHCSVGGARQALESVWAYWGRTLGEVHVETPDRSVDFLVNGWLLYQVLSCRYWARSGFYQSGGAYGFRDQLQDVLALVHAEPRLIREHILRCAAHQFQEGDVQHWWHPPLDRGVRTRISDDYLWLPLVTSQYVRSIGDTGVLDEQVPFLAGRPVKPDEDGYYDLPTHAEETATLYEHCVRAIRNGLKFGEHGLPLMGTGDWNDGMNLVGAQGRGESVWLAFFLHDVLTQFERVARLRNDIAFAELCTGAAAKLAGNIEEHGWDGDWYRRAYFDDGAPLGSASNPECQIDSLPQSWAVLSRAGDPARCRLAMEQVYQRLVRPQPGLIELFDPPFDASHLDPGYVKGYPPGIRENGGQYTHAAVWTAMAFAGLGEVQRAWELLGMINPIHHGDTAEAVEVYRLEPYVLAGDVYTNPQHVGRGGWSWYTGAAGWMYRLILESLLGLQLQVDRLYVRPLLPETWDSFQIHYRYRETFYHITVRKEAGAAVTRVTVDGAERPDRSIQLIDDRQPHAVEVLIGR
jgi:cyclic beta-1,2-glucan synthetase